MAIVKFRLRNLIGDSINWMRTVRKLDATDFNNMRKRPRIKLEKCTLVKLNPNRDLFSKRVLKA